MRKLLSGLSGLLLLLLLASCGSNPYAKTNRMHKQKAKQLSKELRSFPPENGGLGAASLNYGEDWVGTTNFGLRKPNYVIIHHTAQETVEHTLKTFTLPRTSVSSHYVIADNGEIYQMLNDYYRGWHAGSGKWGNDTDLNSSSIGIELDNNGFEPFSETQISSLIDLLKVLKERHRIPAANFIGHSDIAPSRKVDPNRNFPWERLAEEGFGLWYEDLDLEARIPSDTVVVDQGNATWSRQASEELMVLDSSTPDSLASGITPELALRVIGFDTSNLEAAIKAFKLHFIQDEMNAELSTRDLKILYHLAEKYMHPPKEVKP